MLEISTNVIVNQVVFAVLPQFYEEQMICRLLLSMVNSLLDRFGGSVIPLDVIVTAIYAINPNTEI